MPIWNTSLLILLLAPSRLSTFPLRYRRNTGVIALGLLIATCLCSSKQDVIGSTLMKLTRTAAVGENMLPIFQVVYTHNLTHTHTHTSRSSNKTETWNGIAQPFCECLGWAALKPNGLESCSAGGAGFRWGALGALGLCLTACFFLAKFDWQHACNILPTVYCICSLQLLWFASFFCAASQLCSYWTLGVNLMIVMTCNSEI